MRTIFVDCETYYDKEFSLSKLTTEEYIRSPLFEVIGIATKVNDGDITWVTGYDNIKIHLNSLPWDTHLMGAHNCQFDSAILNWIFGIVPYGYICTLSMGNALHGVSESSSLANMAKLYGEVDKGTEVLNALGKRINDFTSGELTAYGEYCKHDTELSYNIFNKMKPIFPKDELRIISLTVQMFSRPVIELDEALLTEDLINIKRVKRESLEKLQEALGVGNECELKKQVMSNPKFAELLKAQGVEPPTKISTKTGKTAWAFAKTDEGLTDLLDHENPIVSTLVSTRLENKSTIGETRTESFIGVAKRGTYPFSLSYSGAKITHRWSGKDLNPQNLPRGSTLRRAIMAPAGHTLVVADSSNIELRSGMWLAGQEDALQHIRDGVDLYKMFASSAFNLDYNSIGKDSNERFIAKVCCIAEGELVLTPEGLIPIESITLDNMVWDGVEWVNHTGVVFMGQREVITYDGLTATEDHKVWTESGRYISFGEATSRLERLARTGDGRQAIRFMDNNKRPDNQKGEAPIRERTVPMRDGEISSVGKSQARVEQTMPHLRNNSNTPKTRSYDDNIQSNETITNTSECDDSTMQQPQRQKIQRLWGARNKIYVWINSRMRGIHNYITKLGSKYAIGNRSDKQQWKLRNREYKIFHQRTTDAQQKELSVRDLQREESPCVSSVSFNKNDQPRNTIRPQHDKQFDNEGLDSRANDREVLPQIRQTKRVYDITNAGSRHRFTVSGRLVSNCLSLIYGTGAAKLKDTIRTQSKGKTSVTIEEAERLKDLYRRVNKYVKEAWYEGGSIIDWIAHDESHTAYGFLPVHGKKGILKPSGLYLPYPGLRQEHNEKGTEWYYDTKRGRNILKDKIYAAKCYQRINQSLARDIVATQTMEINKHYWVAGMVHDEVICVVPDAEVEEAKIVIRDIMRTSPDWAKELPLDCEVGAGKRYGDAK